jgi:hypothetical protein
MNKEQISYAIETLILFLSVAKEGPLGHTLLFKEQAVALLIEFSSGKMNAELAVYQINRLIEALNQVLRAPYPLFKSDSAENLVKTEIVAFEHYLNQELKLKHLTIQQEAPLFNDSLRLWESIGVSVSIEEGVYQFTALIQKLNTLLPENEHYPIPDSDQL